VIQTPGTLTDQKVSQMDVAKPMSNSYPTSSALAAEAVKTQGALLGHNSFRPDVYRVTNGLVS